MEITLGEKIRQLREGKDLSLRGLSKQLGLTAAFLSDVELGRRHPKEDNLQKIADFFQVSIDDLKRHDARPPIAEIRRMVEADPQLGFAFRTAIENVKSGKISQSDLIERLNPKKEGK